MASEDSDRLASGLASVHRLSDLRDLNETFPGSLTTVRYELDAARKPLEVRFLCRPQRVLLKERQD